MVALSVCTGVWYPPALNRVFPELPQGRNHAPGFELYQTRDSARQFSPRDSHGRRRSGRLCCLAGLQPFSGTSQGPNEASRYGRSGYDRRSNSACRARSSATASPPAPPAKVRIRLRRMAKANRRRQGPRSQMLLRQPAPICRRHPMRQAATTIARRQPIPIARTSVRVTRSPHLHTRRSPSLRLQLPNLSQQRHPCQPRVPMQTWPPVVEAAVSHGRQQSPPDLRLWRCRCAADRIAVSKSAGHTAHAAKLGRVGCHASSDVADLRVECSVILCTGASLFRARRCGAALSRAEPRTPADGIAAATPGERQLEGPQQPAIALEKVSPAEIQVGKPATFELYVRNAGPGAGAQRRHHRPRSRRHAARRRPARSRSNRPTARSSGTWARCSPARKRRSRCKSCRKPKAKSAARPTSRFSAAATSRSICTRPQLTIEHTAPPKVLIGESLTVGITVSNPGTGPATGVIIEEDVPAGLSHVAGSQLEYEVGTLRPGESKHLELSLRAEKAGHRAERDPGPRRRQSGRPARGARSRSSRRSLQVDGRRAQTAVPRAASDLHAASRQSRHGRGPRRRAGRPSAARHEIRRDRLARPIRPVAARRLLEPGRAAAVARRAP